MSALLFCFSDYTCVYLLVYKESAANRGIDGWLCMVPVLHDEIFEVDDAGLLHLRCNFTAVDDLEQAWQIPLIE